jgi:formylglycine-generating enzyme
MKRGLFCVALLVACASCVKEHKCRDGTVFLTVKFLDSSDLVDGLALSYLLDTESGTPTPIFPASSPLMRPSGKNQGGFELQIANYAGHQSLVLQYVPTKNTSPVGDWQNDTITLDPGCTTSTLQVGIKTSDGAAMGVDAGADSETDTSTVIPDAATQGADTVPDVPVGGSGGTGGMPATGGMTASGGTASAGGITTTGGETASGGSSGSGGTSSSNGGTWGGTPPSCSGLAATCGPLENEDCCTSLLVPGGTFYRDDQKAYPATVNDFYLDKYEITVGRFRQFVNARMGTQASPPGSGAGANPLITGSGWDSTWNTNLPRDTATLKAAMTCIDIYQTWTDTAGDNESLPQNCMDWYTAFAFCVWDGGRLPTEAEWTYAAAGGNEQRYYPWSSPPTATTIDDGYAVYAPTSSDGARNVGSRSPRGDGKWGQADLAGNVEEWMLDWYGGGTYPMPCDNCAKLTPPPGSSASSYRAVRGGYFGIFAFMLASPMSGTIADSPYYPVGARCARDSL